MDMMYLPRILRRGLHRVLKRDSFLPLLLTGLFVLSCHLPLNRSRSDSPDPRSDLTAGFFQNHPERSLALFHFSAATSLESRIGEPPSVILSYLRSLDERPSYSPYRPTAAQKALVKGVLERLPPLQRKILQERLVGIYFINGFLTSAMSDWALDGKGRMYVYMVVNPAVFQRSASEIINSRESSAYRPPSGGGGAAPQVRLHVGGDLSGMLYILLHESAHVADYVEQITPYTEPGSRPFQLREGPFPVVEGIWKDYRQPLASYDFPGRKRVKFYGMGGGPLLDWGEAPSLYRSLSHTPFVSLYGSQSWAEDLADLLALYHMTQVMGNDYTITVRAADGKETVYRPMDNPLVRARFPLIRKTFY